MGPTLNGQLLSYNVLSNEQQKLKLKKNYSIPDTEALEVPGSTLEVSYDDLMADLQNYTLVSIIEHDEDLETIEGSVQMPLSEMDLTNWSAPNGKPVVFCCARGRRSLQLCNDILKTQPKAKVFSLKGGLRAVPKTIKAEH